MPIITGRNEVVAKVMFLQVSVCPQGGEFVCLSACWDANPPRDQAAPPRPGRSPRTRQTPPGPGRPPRDQGDPPPDQADPPGPGRPPQADTPPPPAGKQTPAYGLRAAGTHPTGMHSCSQKNDYRYLVLYCKTQGNNFKIPEKSRSFIRR